MRVLLTNDDGIDAPGLKVLENIARELSDDMWVVAPMVEQSGKSRAVSLTEPLRLRELSHKRWSVSGTPTDCVIMALQEIMDAPPDLVLSGVNKGQNMGEDTSFSGTIGAALFGMQRGIRSVALSLAQNFQHKGSSPWETAEVWGPKVLKSLLEKSWPEDVIININFPDRAPDDVAGIQLTRQGKRDVEQLKTEKRTDLRGNDYVWLGYGGALSNPPEGTDLRAIYDGYISISPLHVDLTHETFLKTMRAEWAM